MSPTGPAAAAERLPSGYQVAVLGAAGGIGQPLSLLLKMNPLVSSLALYDIANTPGVAADLSHCNTPAQARLPGRARRHRCQKPAEPVRRDPHLRPALSAQLTPWTHALERNR